MPIAELRARIDEITSAEDCSAEFFFLFDGDDEPFTRAADLDGDAQNELAELFRNSIRTAVRSDDAEVISISGADDRANAIYEYDLDQEPLALEVLSAIIDEDDQVPFNANDEDLGQLRAILVLIGNHESQLAIYKHQYPVSFLRPGSWFGLMPGANSRFSKLESDIIKVNGSFEFLTVDGRHYIFNLGTLERFFGFHDAIKNVAEAGIEAIVASNLVVDSSVLEERLDDIAFARKLVRCASGSPVLGNIPAQDVVNFTQQHPALAGQFSYSADGSQLLLSSKASQDRFLKLLNDDYLQSELTNMYYDSIAKNAV